jgi:hypothetical protein
LIKQRTSPIAHATVVRCCLSRAPTAIAVQSFSSSPPPLAPLAQTVPHTERDAQLQLWTQLQRCGARGGGKDPRCSLRMYGQDCLTNHRKNKRHRKRMSHEARRKQKGKKSGNEGGEQSSEEVTKFVKMPIKASHSSDRRSGMRLAPTLNRTDSPPATGQRALIAKRGIRVVSSSTPGVNGGRKGEGENLSRQMRRRENWCG